MKSVLSITTLFFLLTSCYTGSLKQIKIEDDPFKKVRVFTLEMVLDKQDGKLINEKTVFKYIVKKGIKAATKVYLHFQIGSMMGMVSNPLARYRSGNIDNYAYILVDDKSYKLSVAKTQQDRTLTIFGNLNSLVGGTYDDYYCEVTLSPAILRSIAAGKKVWYRFYRAESYTTFVLTDNQVTKLKEFVTLDPKNPKIKPTPLSHESSDSDDEMP